MFDIGWSELLLIAVVAIVVIGPKDLPRVMRLVGQWTARMKRMGREFQNQFNEALREAELDSVKKDIEDIAKTDPLADVRAHMTRVDAGLRADLAKPEPVAPAAVAAPAAAEAPPPAKEGT